MVAEEGRSEEALDDVLILHSRIFSCHALPCLVLYCPDIELTAIKSIVSVYHSNATCHLKCRLYTHDRRTVPAHYHPSA